ncbi:Ldh family oxidoreductase [Bradyrhizobium sp. Ec3.3]|uniref:Ldh family oxidoreductase n=1 Tax=Bradyrhizobium sp. Ec3.3 TaxID=189753 RepID=UPI0004030884|nr:Ldh family oxidoreductase [Bradyrhizobium sp. Ec3.3]
MIGEADLRKFATGLLHAGGLTADHAEQTAAMLVWANTRGADSHGVLRIPRYVEMIELGLINPAASPTQVFAKGAVAVVDAQNAPGAVGMNIAARSAGELARAHGLGWCAVRSITHAGAIGYYAQQVAQAGLIGIAMTASKPLMIYHGSRADGVSTNPIAIAAPTSDPQLPFLLDMSTAAVAIGKVMAAKDAGRSLSPGWAVDEHGMETSDPRKVKSVLPMAGPKGSGLSLMIEVLASVLVGNPLISVALSQDGDPGGNGLVAALDPAAFGSDFTADVDRLRSAIKGLPPAEGVDEVYLPGERGFEESRKRFRDGIPIAQGTLKRLLALASKLNVPAPAGVG